MVHNRTYFHDHKRTLHPIGILLCFLGLACIAFSITLRLIPSAIPIETLALLNTNPAVLNEINAMYQYSLIATLVLSGLFVDIIGPRTVLCIALAVAACANYYFGRGDSLNELLYARVIINYTHPFILTSVLTLGAHWLPRRHFSLYVGLFFSTLLMTPVMVAPLLRVISTLEELNSCIFDVNVFGVLVIAVMVLTEPIIDRTRHRHDLKGLFRPLKHYKVWLISLVAMIGWMANTFVLQYGTFYLVRQYNFTLPVAMATVDIAFMYFGFGAIVMGMTSDFFRQKRFIIALGYCLAAVAFSVLFFLPVPVSMAGPVLYLAAFFTSSTIICYTKANDYCTIGNSGITLGLLLSIMTIGSNFFAKELHHLLLLYVNNPATNSSYYWGMILAVIPAILIIGTLIAFFLLKPSHLHSHTGKKDDALHPPVHSR